MLLNVHLFQGDFRVLGLQMMSTFLSRPSCLGGIMFHGEHIQLLYLAKAGK